MKKGRLVTAVLAGCCAFSAHAGLETTIGLYSDYIFRGVSQTNEDPTPQATLDWFNDSGWYAGLFVSDVDFGESGDWEIDAYGGYSGAFGNSGWEYDIQLVYYAYPDNDFTEDYPELLLGFTYDWFNSQIGYTWDNYGLGETAVYLNIGGEFPLPNEFSLRANVGYYDFDDADNDFFPGAPDSYTDWVIGISRSWSGFDFALDYVDTNSDGEVLFGDNAGDRVVFSVSRTFSLIE